MHNSTHNIEVCKYNIVIFLNIEHSKYIAITRNIDSFLIRCVNEKTQKHLHYDEDFCHYAAVNAMILQKCEIDSVKLSINEKESLLTFLSKHKASFYMSQNLI